MGLESRNFGRSPCDVLGDGTSDRTGAMFGKKKTGTECYSCGRSVRAGDKVCECGTATGKMSFEERTLYEVEQWRRARERTATA